MQLPSSLEQPRRKHSPIPPVSTCDLSHTSLSLGAACSAARSAIEVLPPEIVLKILHCLAPADLASLTRVSQAYHIFIDELNQDRIYAVQYRRSLLSSSGDAGSKQPACCFTKFLDGTTTSWKELCKRRYMLNNNWKAKPPQVRNGTFPAGQMVWRFCCDFDYRFIITTHEEGGLTVFDMDDGTVLWRLKPDHVHENAHLVYSDGWMCFDPSRASIQIWRHDASNRGTFHHVKTLPRNFRIRGFMLRKSTLAAVTDHGEGFVWDLQSDGEPILRRTLQLHRGAIGHLTQNEELVMYSLGSNGFHLHNKTTGNLEGKIIPKCDSLVTFRVEHPTLPWHHANSIFSREHTNYMNDQDIPEFTGWDDVPGQPLMELEFKPSLDKTHFAEDVGYDEQWGAGQLDGNIMVGVSRLGRICICLDWRKAMKSEQGMKDYTIIVECLLNPRIFTMGGWLSIKNGRIVWQVSDMLYLLQLSESTTTTNFTEMVSLHTFRSGGSAVNSFPVSCIEVADDGIAHTYAAYHNPESRFDLKKAVRVVNFCPNLLTAG